MEFDPTQVIASEQPAGQPAPASAGEGGSGATPSGLTKEDVSQIVLGALEQYKRNEQSQRDKLESRVTKSVAKAVELLQKAGIEVTDQVRGHLTEAAQQEASQEQTPPPSPAQPAQAAPTPEGAPDPFQPFYAAAAEIMAEHGVTFDPNDPEAQALKDFKGKPHQWLKLVEQQAAAKAARTHQRPGSTLPTPGNGAPAGPTYAKKPSLDILTEGYRKR